MVPSVTWILSHEVQTSRRYLRYLSIVLVAPGKDTNGKLHRTLSESFRDCDVMVPVNGHTAVILSETDREGALRAIGRCRKALKASDASFSTASFPTDAHDAAGLLKTAVLRLERAQQGERAGVVADG